jgi:hypothetical protein
MRFIMRGITMNGNKYDFILKEYQTILSKAEDNIGLDAHKMVFKNKSLDAGIINSEINDSIDAGQKFVKRLYLLNKDRNQINIILMEYTGQFSDNQLHEYVNVTESLITELKKMGPNNTPKEADAKEVLEDLCKGFKQGILSYLKYQSEYAPVHIRHKSTLQEHTWLAIPASEPVSLASENYKR